MAAVAVALVACQREPLTVAGDAAPDAPAPDMPAPDAPPPDTAPDAPAPDATSPDAPAPDLTADQLAPDLEAGPDAPPSCPAGYWCSKLYPPGWTPTAAADAKGRFLHDFSYAGYHNSEKALPVKAPGKMYDVVSSYGADNTGKKDATSAIQKAIAAAQAANGGVVYLPAGTYRCDGKLSVTKDKVVLRGAGAGKSRLHFSSFKGMGGGGHITFSGKLKYGPDVPLAADGKNRSVTVLVNSATGLAAGDEVAVGWVITTAFVKDHGMSGYWKPFYNQWKPFFRRTIKAVDASASPVKITLDVPLRYHAQLKYKASLRKESGYLSECGMEHLSVSNAVKWEDAWSNNQVHAVKMNQVKDCWIRGVSSVKSLNATGWNKSDKTAYHLQSSGVRVTDSKRVTITKTVFENPQHRGGGGNGYLFHITRSNEVLVVDSVGRQGRHNLIQNWDFGTTGCVFLRCKSEGSHTVTMVLGIAVKWPAMSECHHSLAMANLVDHCQIEDGWMAANRLFWSSGAGHTSTQCAFWNTSGGGTLQSMQYGWGYIIGTGAKTKIDTSLLHPNAAGSAPQDYVEGAGKGGTLWPQSLFQHQLARRLP